MSSGRRSSRSRAAPRTPRHRRSRAAACDAPAAGPAGPARAAAPAAPARAADPRSAGSCSTEPIGPKCDHTVDDRFHPRPVVRGWPPSGMHALRERHAGAGPAARHVLGDLREPVRTADPVPARRARAAEACRTTGASTIPDSGASSLFDQRGAGRSTPIADVTDNTTAHLVDDIETPARAPGDRALGAVRRVLGLDARTRLRAGASGPLPGAGPARHLPRHAPRRSTGSWTACAISSRRRGAISRISCRRRSAATCSRATTAGSPMPTRPCTCPPPAPGTATKARARRSSRVSRHRAHRRRCGVARDRAHRSALLRP